MLPGPLQSSLPSSLGAALCFLVPLMLTSALISVDVVQKGKQEPSGEHPTCSTVSFTHPLSSLSSALKRLDHSSVAAAACSSLQGLCALQRRGTEGAASISPWRLPEPSPMLGSRLWVLSVQRCPRRGLCLLLPSAL